MCKILVQNFIIKDILKKKNDVHWISVRTIVLGEIWYILYLTDNIKCKIK